MEGNNFLIYLRIYSFLFLRKYGRYYRTRKCSQSMVNYCPNSCLKNSATFQILWPSTFYGSPKALYHTEFETGLKLLDHAQKDLDVKIDVVHIVCPSNLKSSDVQIILHTLQEFQSYSHCSNYSLKLAALGRKMCEREIVLITGGAGFLGQHLIREIQEKCFEIDEIRVLDLVKYENKLNHKERIEVKSFIWNIATECDFAFENVKTVFHCAALINYEFPPIREININVKATQNIIESCLRNGVESLIYTSTAEVCIKPYFNNGFFCISINRTESKELPPEDEEQLVFGPYAASKLKSEELILAADTENHYSGNGILRTTALRPPFIYGEEDNGIFKKFIEIGKKNDNCLWRIGGPGGKHQFAYAGNIAWAHIMAGKQLKNDPNKIGGLPIFTTDDTGIFDFFKFCEILTEDNGKPHIKKSNWSIPSIISFFIFYIFEIVYSLLFNFGLKRLPFSPKSLVVYLGSAVLFSRLRSTLHTGYSPCYNQDESLKKSRNYYLSKCKIK